MYFLTTFNWHTRHTAREAAREAEASALALHVELRAGDALYLPCGWWHDVRTPTGERSLSLSLWAQQPESKLLATSDDPGGEHESAEAESRFAIR